jgi:hypothetical protein
MLTERGRHPLVARGLSYWLVRLGKAEANKVAMPRAIVDALRFLAKPGRSKGWISRKAAILLKMWNTTSNLSDVFDGANPSYS